MNVYIPYTRLPSEYQEVEYISSSNEQYIETWLSSDWSYLKADYKFQLLSTSSDRYDIPPFIRWPVVTWQIYQTIDGSRTNFQFGAWDDDIYLSSISTNTDYTVVAEWNNWTLSTNINWTTSTNSYSWWLSTHTIPIFCRWRNESLGYNAFSSIKLYYFKLYTASNTLARDLVPCYRKSDWVIWMYDLVNNQFYTNSWSGTFSKGNDVTMSEVKNIYIGEVVDCDFTTWDYWFTFYGRTTSAVNYGRDSNWLYLSITDYTAWAAWKIPSSIYSRWTIKKIEFKFYSTTAGCWWWISYQTDTQFSRVWTSWVSWATWFDNNWGTHSNTPVSTPAWWYTFTIDLENKLLSASFTNTTFSLSNNDVSTIRNYWSNWNINILWVLRDNNSTVTWYIQRATFYF